MHRSEQERAWLIFNPAVCTDAFCAVDIRSKTSNHVYAFSPPEGLVLVVITSPDTSDLVTTCKCAHTSENIVIHFSLMVSHRVWRSYDKK